MTDKKVQKNGRTILTTKLERENGEIHLFIKTNSEIEHFFNKNCDVHTSTAWTDKNDNPLQFYKKNEGTVHNGFDLYGDRLLDIDGGINIALLRTVGISNGITFKFKGVWSEDQLINAMKGLKDLTKSLYSNYIKKVKINVKLEIEEL